MFMFILIITSKVNITGLFFSVKGLKGYYVPLPHEKMSLELCRNKGDHCRSIISIFFINPKVAIVRQQKAVYTQTETMNGGT